MSITSQGPGWWQASDDKWYSPEKMPAHVAPVVTVPKPAAPVVAAPPMPVAGTTAPQGPGWYQASDGQWYPQPYPIATTVTATHGSGFAVTSMVLGIVALALSFIPLVNAVTFPLAVVALPFGGIAMTKKYPGHGMAITGVVTAVLSLGVAIAMIASFSNA